MIELSARWHLELSDRRALVLLLLGHHHLPTRLLQFMHVAESKVDLGDVCFVAMDVVIDVDVLPLQRRGD